MKSYLKLDIINEQIVGSMSMWCVPDNILWFYAIIIVVTQSEINPFHDKKKIAALHSAYK